MLIKNTNERFGECGTFEAESVDELMAEMDPQIVIWTREEANKLNDARSNGEPSEGEDGPTFDELYARVRDEFRAGLEVVEPLGVKIGPGW